MSQKRVHPGGGPDPKRPRPDLSKSIEEARRRAQEAFKKSGLLARPPQTPAAAPSSSAAAAAPSRPPPVAPPAAPPAPPPAAQRPSTGFGRANMRPPPSATRIEEKPTGIHPLLMGEAARIQERLRALAPKIAASTAPAEDNEETPVKEKVNPYLSANDPSEAGPRQKSMKRALQFHRPGRYIMAAEQARRDEQMEQLKQRIEERARRAGLQDELLDDERTIRREEPPEAEWWDVGLLRHKSYSDVPDEGVSDDMLIHVAESPIDHLVQHPIPIPAPTSKLYVAERGVMLTKEEMKKMRKQRRAAEQQDKRDRIKMGLLPPDPPKVKLSNLMRVLSSEAVADPTKVEARVRREVAARREAHERANAERMLTDEERRERRHYKTSVEEDKGIWCQVYRIRHLVSPSHRFKVRKNAQQHHLGGIVVTHPDFSLVVVEGSAKALKAYKRLMLVRIDWTDPGRPKTEFDDPSTVRVEEPEMDLYDNTCDLVFEGPVRDRSFGAATIRIEEVPTDSKAKEILGPNLAGYWDVAKRSGTSID
ncbi:U4/U5/U6 small nuclear ribonucleoprotein prp3 [Malassezia cuniculi]|uniref:U4/U5/U6 small nuclear ribonucleoprotein prp3 n=1 Tax=Malassezia cuniculi TaxID=948313 RepID=A0AAF0J5B5_9BASI|nr:U4/U5/U6 small nuclear ribonucleoprotein prp3 [Malassezia cuniculi]